MREETRENIYFSKVVDHDDSTLTPNKRIIYHNLIRNPGKARRDTKKRASSCKYFPKPRLERIKSDVFPLLQLINYKVAEYPTPPSDTINTATPPDHTPNPSKPIPSPSSRICTQKKKLKEGNIGYKFQKFFSGYGYY